MKKSILDRYINILRDEIKPALGCTEPAAVALAAAQAAAHLKAKPTWIEIYVSKYIFKNGMYVGIPGTERVGLDIAAAMGAVVADPEKNLMILMDMSIVDILLAEDLVDSKSVVVKIDDNSEKIYIRAIVSDGKNTCEAVIKDTHTNVVYIRRNDTVILDKKQTEKSPHEGESTPDYGLNIEEIYRFVEEIPMNDLLFLNDVIKLNKKIAKDGITNDYGLKVGKNLRHSTESNLMGDDIVNYAVTMTAAAADARMSGSQNPVMSVAGSGNQGITASIPIISIAERLGCSMEKTLRSLAMSILITIHAKHSIGRLSVLCGCSIAAAIGACCGIIYLFDGELENIKCGIQTMVADISGMICDGAKPGCALKIATSVSAAIRAATLALKGIGATQYDGIVDLDVERTLKNLGELGDTGMFNVNETILNIMINKA